MSFKVAFLGFTDFERSALTSYFRLAHNRQPAYEQVPTLTDAEFLVADADHAPSVQLVVVTERLNETVFVGAQPPAGHRAWMMRPIDALQVMRELDAMVAAGGGGVRSSVFGELGRRDTVIQPPRRTKVEEAGERLASGAVTQPAAPREPMDLALPASLAPVPPPVPLPPTVLPRPAAPPPLPRALLVDDSELALRFLDSKLSRWRLEIDHASTSAQALQLMELRAYDFIFLDVELGPESTMDGLELCRHIKQSPEWMHAAIIMVSVHHSVMDRVRGALVGCDAYLGKPLDEVELQRLMLRQGL